MNFQTFKIKFYDFITDDPSFCIYNGINKNLGELPDPGKNKRITNQGKLKMLNNALSKVSQEDFSVDDKVDFELYTLFLEQLRLSYELEINNVPHNMRMPMACDIISGPLFTLFIHDQRDEKYRIVNMVSRLEKSDQFITSYCRNIKSPVDRWVQMELAKLSGLPTFFQSIIEWAKNIGFKNILSLEKAVAKTNSALKRYADFLKNVEKSKDIFLGEEQTKLVIKSLGINLSLDELHTIAKEFTLKNQSEVNELKQKLVAKYGLADSITPEELQSFLNEKFQVEREGEGFDYILSKYKKESESIISFINERNLFPLNLNQEMKIIQTPDFMKPSIPAGAMMPPLAMRDGTKTSMVYLTLSDDLLAEHTHISIPGMMIHEGIPGHHLQFSWASSHKDFIRKVFSANDLSEGWTTMLEDYMIDIGYSSELADEIRFSGKRDIARIGARVAIDLYFMSGDKKYLDIGIDGNFNSDDPFANAGALLKEVTGFVDDRIEGELNWYSQERGYPLSYLTGNFLVWELKKKFQNKYKENLSQPEIDLKFHEAFLKAGNMPVSLLEKILL